MALNIWNLEWLNHNSQRSYPIVDWASRLCNLSSDIKLPNDLILALSLSANSSHNIDIDKFYIKSVSIMSKFCNITIGYKGEDQDVAEITIYTDSIQNTYSFIGLGTFDDIRGYIGINPASIAFTTLSGYFTFDYEATAIEPDCIRLSTKMLSSFQLDEGRVKSKRLYNNIILEAGDNFQLEANTVDDKTTIVFNAIDGALKEELNKTSQNEECIPKFAKKRPILTINGIKPDKDGNIDIEGVDSASFRKISHGVKIEDPFSEPCCECDELEELYNKLNALIAQYSPMKALADDIDTRQQILDEGGNTCQIGSSCNCIKEKYEEEGQEDHHIVNENDTEVLYYIKVPYYALADAPEGIRPFDDPSAMYGLTSFRRVTDDAVLNISEEKFIIDAFTMDASVNIFNFTDNVYDGYRRLVIPWPATAPAVAVNNEGGFFDPDNIHLPGVKLYVHWHYKYTGDPKSLQYIELNHGEIPGSGVKSFDVYRMGLHEYNKRYASDEWQIKYRN